MQLVEKHVRVAESVDVHVEGHYDPETEDYETYVIFKSGDETILRFDWHEWTTIIGFVEAAWKFEH